MTRIQRTAEGLCGLAGQTGPPVSVHAVSAMLDVGITRADLPPTVPGLVIKRGGTWEIFVNDWHDNRRRRWTAAHEVGHIALEHQGNVLYFEDPKACERPWQQREANRFAAELLMPESMVRQAHAEALEKGLSLRDLADIFLVNRRAIELRLAELNLQL